MENLIDRLLSNLNNFAELGRQRAFELGNPFYYKEEGDGEYWRKEYPNGDIFLVSFDIEFDDKGHPIKIINTFKKKIN